MLVHRRRRDAVEVAQRRDTALTDHPIGLLGDDTEHAGDRAVVVVHRAVGERVVGLLLVAGPLEEEQQ